MERNTEITALVTKRMMAHDAGDSHRINHFMKVHAYAALIGHMEKLDGDMQLILEVAALMHDIGIKPALQKHGSHAGPLQEKEGPPLARGLLEGVQMPEAAKARVCELIGRHHTYTGIDGADCRILIEADFLVNIDEGRMENRQGIRESIFRTAAGLYIFDKLFA